MGNVPAVLATTVPPSAALPAIATTIARVDSDDHLVDLWLHGLAPSTQRAYAADTAAFRAQVGCPLPAVTLGAVHDFMDGLAALAPATQARRLSAVKSLLSFGQRVGYLRINVARRCACPR